MASLHIGAGRTRHSERRISPMAMALVGVLVYRSLKGKGRLAELLGQSNDGIKPGAANGSLGAHDLDRLLSGGIDEMLPGEDVGGAVCDSLCHLLQRFRQNGLGEKAQSWVSDGPNKPVRPAELEQGLGGDTVRWLVIETGLPKDQLLSGLGRYLPEAVNRLTPDGKLPSPQEAARRLQH